MTALGTTITGFGTVSEAPDLPAGFAERFRSDRYHVGDIVWPTT